MPSYQLRPVLLQAVIDHVAAGENNAEVHRATGVSRLCIQKMRLSLEYWDTPYPPQTVRLRRPSTLRQAQREGLQAYLKGKPSAYLEEIRNFLYDNYNVTIPALSVY